jgi:hypothetical protein
LWRILEDFSNYLFGDFGNYLKIFEEFDDC